MNDFFVVLGIFVGSLYLAMMCFVICLLRASKMKDIAEQAFEEEQAYLDSRISRIVREGAKLLPLTGKCDYCGHELQIRRYCDKHCQEDHEFEMAAKLRNQGPRMYSEAW